MTTLSEFFDAVNDKHLRERFVTAAQEAGVRNPEFWVDQNRGDLTRSKVGDPGNANATVASVYAYASGEYKRLTPPLPGLNPGAVTDDHIRYAVQQVLTPPMPEE